MNKPCRISAVKKTPNFSDTFLKILTIKKELIVKTVASYLYTVLSLLHFMRAIARAQASTSDNKTVSPISVYNTYCLGHCNEENV